jgi:hypothetical protein
MAKDVGIPGIAPEDVKVTKEQQAQIDSYLAQQKREEEELGKEEPIELMESEIMGCKKVMEELYAKYSYRKASYENLLSMKQEADEKFGKIGLQVVVDWVLPSISQKPTPPTITIVGRTNGKEYNPEQARWEIGHGVADEYYDMKRAQKKSKLIIPGQ